MNSEVLSNVSPIRLSGDRGDWHYPSLDAFISLIVVPVLVVGVVACLVVTWSVLVSMSARESYVSGSLILNYDFWVFDQSSIIVRFSYSILPNGGNNHSSVESDLVSSLVSTYAISEAYVLITLRHIEFTLSSLTYPNSAPTSVDSLVSFPRTPRV